MFIRLLLVLNDTASTVQAISDERTITKDDIIKDLERRATTHFKELSLDSPPEKGCKPWIICQGC
jgi:hypothetical protein